MDYNERICVLIPAYNMGKYLESCIDSVLAQTYRNIRVLLVDDGSTDNTKEICEKYKEKDSRFESIHIENSGHGIARNVGMFISWSLPSPLVSSYKSVSVNPASS